MIFRTVKKMVEEGADVNSNRDGLLTVLCGTRILSTYTGVCPLHMAASSGYAPLVSLLLENGADPNARANSGLTPIFYAKDVTIFQLLLDAGADVNATNNTGRSVMFNGGLSMEVAQYLMSRGVDLSIRDKERGETALQHIENFSARLDLPPMNERVRLVCEYLRSCEQD